jgi:hypothetical protein
LNCFSNDRAVPYTSTQNISAGDIYFKLLRVLVLVVCQFWYSWCVSLDRKFIFNVQFVSLMFVGNAAMTILKQSLKSCECHCLLQT